MRKLTSLVAALFLIFSSYGQSISVKGTVFNSQENKPVYNAVASLIDPADSILYKFTRTDAEGRFELKNVLPGKYILMVSQPYFADLVQDIDLAKSTELPEIGLISKSTLLQEVIVNTGTPFRIKGDTTVYTADSFQVSANANVEELLKKLPGIQVDKDGNIKAMGETVKKVLVDGEEFFGEDPGMAVKNLRADAVKEVQVFDKKSEQAEFTGIDDGNTQKTINLKLKDNAKKGYFGKIDVAGGPQKDIDNRFNTNLMFSSFRGKRKLSTFLLHGNTGQDRLNWEDEQKYGGSNDNIQVMDDGGIMITSGGSGGEEPYIDSRNGYMTNVNAGLQYSNKWNDKYNFNFTPRYNSQDYNNRRDKFTQTQLEDSVLNENSTELSHVNRNSLKLRGVWDLMLDSSNSLKITANSNFYNTENDNSITSVSTGEFGTLKNSSERNSRSKSDKASLQGTILFKHKFKKDRRTFSLNADWYSLNNDGTSFLKSFNQSYLDGLPAGSRDINQMKDFKTYTQNVSAGFIYTEPLSKEYSLELGYKLSYNYGTNDQFTHSYSPGSGKFDDLVDSLSNQFKQNILQHVPSAKLNFANKKWKINAGAGVGLTSYELQDISFNKEYDREYVNFYPTANATYTYKPNHSIRVNYNGNTRQPSINQLQPLRNNDDYFNQYIGNPDLKPSFTNSFNVSHNSYNFLSNLWMYQSFYTSFTSNSITNNRVINIDSGKTVTRPVNTNGNINMGLYSGFGFKLKKMEVNVDLSPSFNYARYADIINNKTSFSKTFSPGMSVGLYKSKEKKYDLMLRNQLDYNSNVTTQNDTKIQYFTNDLNFTGRVYMDKVWSFTTDYNFYSQQKTLKSGENLNRHLLNLRLERTFKDNEFTAYITVRDLLNQNIGIDRNLRGNVYSETTDDRLKRYFMVGFAWNFKNKTATSK